jgi:hypothetical protein
MKIENERSSLSRNLDEILARSGGGSVSIGSVLEGVGDKGFGLLLVILSLPSALPLPAPGYSTPFGILLAILSVQMILLREHPVLPGFARSRSLKHATAVKLFGAANAFLHRIEKLIHPRMQWIGRPAGRAALGWLTLLMSCLMILPIPLTNTAPAMVIFLVGVGLSEDDGLFAVASFALGALAAAFYAVVVVLLLTLGAQGIDTLKDSIRSLKP